MRPTWGLTQVQLLIPKVLMGAEILHSDHALDGADASGPQTTL